MLNHLRNALIHSFGLWSKQRDETGFEYLFVLDDSRPGTLLEWNTPQAGTRKCLVRIYTLHDCFEAGLQRFIAWARNEIQIDSEYSSNIRDLLDRYGSIGVDNPSAFGFR